MKKLLGYFILFLLALMCIVLLSVALLYDDSPTSLHCANFYDAFGRVCLILFGLGLAAFIAVIAYHLIESQN